VQHVPVPDAGRAVDTSHPDHVIGNGSPASCSSRKVVRAVARGGVITFDCGPDPMVIGMRHTAKVVNTSSRVVIDGGGLVALSGRGHRRILYQDTCDKRQTWTTDHCDDQAHPKLVVQNLTLQDGNSTGSTYEGGGGGAIFDRGGQLKIVHTLFLDNRCDRTGPDLGGAAVRALSQYAGRPVYVVGSTFGRGICSNGSGLSSIGVSWQVPQQPVLPEPGGRPRVRTRRGRTRPAGARAAPAAVPRWTGIASFVFPFVSTSNGIST